MKLCSSSFCLFSAEIFNSTLSSNLGNYIFKRFIFTLHVEYFAYMYNVDMCGVPMETQRGCQVSWNWSYRWVLAAMQVLGIKLRTLKEQSVLLIVEPSPWPHTKTFSYYHYHYYYLLHLPQLVTSVLSFELSENYRD